MKEVTVINSYIEVDPARVLADDNLRFGLKKSKVEEMKASILEKGGVMVPVEIEPLEGVEDYDYRITTGHYRHAGLVAANSEGAGLMLPAIIHTPETKLERRKRQLSENMDRENMTPMDMAGAIQTIMAEGATRTEVRNLFKRPGPGKALKMASNSWVNITLSFLELPKKIQNKIHNGEVGVKAAYELMKAYKVATAKGLDPTDTVNKILEAAETEVMKSLEQDAQDEEKLLAAEAKEAEEQKKLEATQKELEAAKQAVEDKIVAANKLAEEGGKLYQATKNIDADVEVKKAAYEAFRAKEKEAALAERELAKARDAAAKLEGKVKTAAETATERAKTLKDAREAATKTKGKGPNQEGIRKAAAAVGATDKDTPLTTAEMRKFVADLCLPGGDPKVIALGAILRDHFSGKINESKAYKGIKELLGVVTVPKKTLVKSKTEAA